jgi:hypothetical protein
VFVVLDHFEVFASRQRQTLLYNLFDVTQSAVFQLCVVGVTARLDVMESMEKRLRSRFSQRHILFGPLRPPHARALIVDALTLPTDGSASADARDGEGILTYVTDSPLAIIRDALFPLSTLPLLNNITPLSPTDDDKPQTTFMNALGPGGAPL